MWGLSHVGHVLASKKKKLTADASPTDTLQLPAFHYFKMLRDPHYRAPSPPPPEFLDEVSRNPLRVGSGAALMEIHLSLDSRVTTSHATVTTLNSNTRWIVTVAAR